MFNPSKTLLPLTLFFVASSLVVPAAGLAATETPKGLDNSRWDYLERRITTNDITTHENAAEKQYTGWRTEVPSDSTQTRIPAATITIPPPPSSPSPRNGSKFIKTLKDAFTLTTSTGVVAVGIYLPHPTKKAAKRTFKLLRTHKETFNFEHHLIDGITLGTPFSPQKLWTKTRLRNNDYRKFSAHITAMTKIRRTATVSLWLETPGGFTSRQTQRVCRAAGKASRANGKTGLLVAVPWRKKEQAMTTAERWVSTCGKHDVPVRFAVNMRKSENVHIKLFSKLSLVSDGNVLVVQASNKL